MNIQSKFDKLPRQTAPVIRHTISTAATDGSGVEASGIFDILRGAATGALGALG
ncbi:MAG: hypothetical protein F6K31_08430 [Symploca sp. SIO2G7]|nr:hypothetical protein [Symploca sp. SIO2G7]